MFERGVVCAVSARNDGDRGPARTRQKKNNATAALLCGVVPAILLSFRFSASWKQWLLGLIVGLSWGNAFEYVYHRWLLHRPRSPLGAGHQRHHSQIGTPEEAEHVALITSPLNVVVLFAINGALAYPCCVLLGLRGILAGIFLGWTIYLIAAEEIHWRIHRNSWLPPVLRFARPYHLSHHDIPNSRYNVFLPLFDFLFGNTGPGKSKLPA
jgi:hypothetical protein